MRIRVVQSERALLGLLLMTTTAAALLLGVVRGAAEAEGERLPGWGGERHTATDDSCHIHPHTELVRALGCPLPLRPPKTLTAVGAGYWTNTQRTVDTVGAFSVGQIPCSIPCAAQPTPPKPQTLKRWLPWVLGCLAG